MSLNKRYLGAVILAPLLIILFLGGIYLKIFVFALSMIGLYEYYKVSREANLKPISIVGYLLCIAYYVLINYKLNYKFVLFMIVIGIFIMLCVPTLDTKYNYIDISVTILGFIYVAVFFSFIALTNDLKYGNYLLWIIFIASWLCDTLAYYSGRIFGKTKLCPKVSPKKTIEGSIGGVLGSVIGCTVYGFIISKYGVNIAIYHYIIIGILCGVFSQFGDLAASSINEHAQVKDYSNLIPGHWRYFG
ncbi:CDP-diglyceride synthetase [Clostridium acetobutylicum ATCC 824]|uniref:Phosphatidate cytidylyltransferase n=1 Tax=Clostridium acetobutylicum (strain ATCC 824 / DSM 792 / JCM 1419 / IAM 19013 / LMG 5710 / NBRC 13948 / NRRL B-527 / VKM B-1787 / 2291 / W) TaxID=272562 RepID=Q97I61_CLOAB|nr:CDP-diglyceride synthetase [Clostridium acetobutylicum ATCC 824]